MNRVFELILGLGLILGLAKCNVEWTESEMLHTKSKGGGWSQSGPMVADSGSAVQMQVNFPVAGAYTVQFGISKQRQADIIDARGEIAWSTEGNTIRRAVTVNDDGGLSVSGVGQSATVRIVDVATGLSPGALYTATIMMAPGSRPSQSQPPTLQPDTQVVGGVNTPIIGLIAVPAGQSVDVLVPLDAGCISVLVTAFQVGVVLTPAMFEVRHLNPSGLGSGTKIYFPDLSFVPLGPNTSIIKLVNNTAAGINCSVTFGIDG